MDGDNLLRLASFRLSKYFVPSVLCYEFTATWSRVMRDAQVYIKECWATAIAIRERRKALVSMIAAFLAFPIIWLLGGRPELAQQWVMFFAEWVSASAFLNVFVFAPFLVWKKQRADLIAVTSSRRPRFCSLPIQSVVPGILIEPTGTNRLDVSIVLLNQNSEALRCVGETRALINGVATSQNRTEPSIVGANNVLRITLSFPNVVIEPVNAMVSEINVSIAYNMSYTLAEFPSAPPRTTGKTIIFRAPIHMTGKSANNEVLCDYTEEVET